LFIVCPSRLRALSETVKSDEDEHTPAATQRNLRTAL
jgi:hypothetical protein